MSYVSMTPQTASQDSITFNGVCVIYGVTEVTEVDKSVNYECRWAKSVNYRLRGNPGGGNYPESFPP